MLNETVSMGSYTPGKHRHIKSIETLQQLLGRTRCDVWLSGGINSRSSNRLSYPQCQVNFNLMIG